VQVEHFKQLQEFKMGSHSFSESSIMEYAAINDPLPFHCDKNEALKSKFKGLVCSGSQPFNFFYVNHWVPRFGETVLAGLAVNNWNFHAPVYADETINGFCSVSKVSLTKRHDQVVVNWHFRFNKPKGEIKQSLDLSILHQTD